MTDEDFQKQLERDQVTLSKTKESKEKPIQYATCSKCGNKKCIDVNCQG